MGGFGRVTTVEAASLLAVGLVALALAVRGFGWLEHFPARSYQFLTSADAKTGTVIRLPVLDVFGRKVLATKPHLLVLLGSCDGCALTSFDPDKLSAPGFEVILVGQSAESDLRKAFKQANPRYKVVADPEEELASQLNLCFQPRCYVVTQGRLVWQALRPNAYPAGVTYDGKNTSE